MKKLILIIVLCLFNIFSFSNSLLANNNEQPNLTNNQENQPTVNPNEDKSYNEKLQILVPSQEKLFDISHRNDLNRDGVISDDEKIRLADGDLEQGLAPRILKILISFSPIAFTVLLVFTGVKLILSRGNEDAYTNTKNMIVQILIGVILITASFGIIIGIINLFDSL